MQKAQSKIIRHSMQPIPVRCVFICGGHSDLIILSSFFCVGVRLMSLFKKPAFLVLIVLLLVGGTGAGLYFSGNLPAIPGLNIQEAAADGADESGKKDENDDEPEDSTTGSSTISSTSIQQYFSGSSLRVIRFPRCRITRRWIKFSSSRTFPGHE